MNHKKYFEDNIILQTVYLARISCDFLFKLTTLSALLIDLLVLNKLSHSTARSTRKGWRVKSEFATLSRRAVSIQRWATDQQSQQQQARRVEIDVHNNK